MSKKNNLWPKMFFCKTTGAYIVCENEDKVPDGYVASIAGVDDGVDVSGELQKDTEAQVKIDNDLPFDDEIVRTLEDFDMSRKEALDFLAEEKIKHKKKITDSELAELVLEAFEKDIREREALANKALADDDTGK